MTTEKVTKAEKIEKTTELLKSYRTIKNHINVLSFKIGLGRTHLRCEDAINTTSFGSIGSKGNINNIVESTVIREISEIERLETEMEVYSYILEIIKNAVDSLKNEEKKVIYLYYLLDFDLSWSDIARYIHKSEATVKRHIRERALLNIYSTLSGESKIKNLLNNIS